MKKINELYNNLVNGGYFTDKELELLTNINGYNMETLIDAIYARYGYRSFEDLLD